MARQGRGGVWEKRRFSGDRIVATLKGSETRGYRRTVPAARDRRVCFYRWKSKLGGSELSEARRLQQLEEENRELKHIGAEQAVDIRPLKAVVAKKW